MEIKPHFAYAVRRDHSLCGSLSVADITSVLGVAELTHTSDRYKIKHEWSFTADGVPCGIWSYKNTRWSVSGPAEVFRQLFGAAFVERPGPLPR